jgi:hypothetical protein
LPSQSLDLLETVQQVRQNDPFVPQHARQVQFDASGSLINFVIVQFNPILLAFLNQILHLLVPRQELYVLPANLAVYTPDACLIVFWKPLR